MNQNSINFEPIDLRILTDFCTKNDLFFISSADTNIVPTRDIIPEHHPGVLSGGDIVHRPSFRCPFRVKLDNASAFRYH